MRQNDIYRPRPTDVALSGSAGPVRALHIGQLQVVLDAARRDSEVDNAVGFLEELATMCSVARGWLTSAHREFASAAEVTPAPALLSSGPPAAEDLAATVRPVEDVSLPAQAPPSLLEPRGYGTGSPGGS